MPLQEVVTMPATEARVDGVSRATGQSRAEWFAELDAWGASGRPYRDIADWLTAERHLSRWWAQKIIVEYEEARGLRQPGVRRDGTFEVTASKNIAAPLGQVQSAFTDRDTRRKWLPDADFDGPDGVSRVARFEWADGASRVVVTFHSLEPARTSVAVQHQRLPDTESAQRMKTFWRDRLAALKELLTPGARQ